MTGRHALIAAALISAVPLGLLGVQCARLGAACSPARLLLGPDRLGERLYQDRDYGRAASAFYDPEWRAAALYRAGEFEEAAVLYSGIAGADARLNEGNALVFQGEYGQAVEQYDRALAERPGWAAAEANRAIAAGRAERLELKGGDMTGGMLGADEIVFGEGAPDDQGAQTEIAGGEASDAELRAIWLRQVQTRPGDFLRARFAYEQASSDSGQDPE